MSTETQNHGEWVAIENERRTKQHHANAIEALYGPGEYVKAAIDYAHQAGRTAKALEAAIQAGDEYLRLTDESKSLGSRKATEKVAV